jgi:hypothetical protein
MIYITLLFISFKLSEIREELKKTNILIEKK